MRIKLAILEKDVGYLNRIVAVFNQKYSEKVQVYSFTDADVAYQTIRDTKIDVFIANDIFEIDTKKIPSRCGFAYFVDSQDIDMLNNQRTICKFQKVDLIYKQILSIYSENAENITGLKITDDDCKLIAFCSPSGGSGSSTIAASSAIHYAVLGKKTLYLNLEKFGSSDTFFTSEGQFDMSDIIFALKSKKANLGMKLESCVKQDKSGVYFFSAAKQSLDMLELKQDEIMRLISELQLVGSYEYIIADFDFCMNKDFINLLQKFHSIVLTGTGSEISNNKIHRFYNSLILMDRNEDSSILNRISILYNKFSNKTSKVLNNVDIKNIGGIPKFEHATDKQVVEEISKMPVVEKII